MNLSRILARAGVVLGLLAVALVTPTVHAGRGQVQVPIRWCAVQGSPAVLNPACSCQANTAMLVTVRGFKATRSYNNCRTIFRPAGNVGTSGIIPNVQVIADPCDPTVNPTCPGVQGEIFINFANNNLTEYFQVVAACRAAWNTTNASAAGLVGVNIRRFVDAAGNGSMIAGLGGTPIFNIAASQAAFGQFAVTDDDFNADYTNYPAAGGNILGDICPPGTPHPSTPPCLPQWFTDSADTLTAHEIGHALSLGHLAGTVMNATVPAPETMTAGGFGQTVNICPASPFPAAPSSQCGTVRLQSVCTQNGTIVDPPPVVDEQPFPVGDVPTEFVDLDLAGIVDDWNTGVASLFIRAAGLFPNTATGIRYEFALDLDQNSFTGGDPAMAGVQIPLQGAELVGWVKVDVAGGVPVAVDGLHRWDDGTASFLPEPSMGSSAQVLNVYWDEAIPDLPITSGDASTSGPAQVAVNLDFDRNLLTGVPSTYTFQVRAFDPGSGEQDLPSAAELYLHEPSLPVCELVPDEAAPGEPITVTATNLNPNAGVVVWFDKGGAPVEVGGGTTDPTGFVSANFSVPFDAAPGMHQVAVVVDSPDAVSSHCSINVLPALGNPGESSMGGGQMIVTAYDKLADQLTISYDPSCGASDHTVYSGELGSVSGYPWDKAECGLGVGGTASFSPGGDNRFFVVVGHNGAVEGSYGLGNAGLQRPEDTEAVSTCSLAQDLTLTCF